MRQSEQLNAACPIRSILDRISGKWPILILKTLGDGGVLRFNEISKSLGDISQKMLTTTLRSLESDGIITRKMYTEIPPRVEYELTDLGQDLLHHMHPLIKWAEKNKGVIEGNRVKRD